MCRAHQVQAHTISPPCAAQIAAESAAWLQPPTLSHITALLRPFADTSDPPSDDSPAPAQHLAADTLAAAELASAALGAWAAALSFLTLFLNLQPEVNTHGLLPRLSMWTSLCFLDDDCNDAVLLNVASPCAATLSSMCQNCISFFDCWCSNSHLLTLRTSSSLPQDVLCRAILLRISQQRRTKLWTPCFSLLLRLMPLQSHSQTLACFNTCCPLCAASLQHPIQPASTPVLLQAETSPQQSMLILSHSLIKEPHSKLQVVHHRLCSQQRSSRQPPAVQLR